MMIITKHAILNANSRKIFFLNGARIVTEIKKIGNMAIDMTSPISALNIQNATKIVAHPNSPANIPVTPAIPPQRFDPGGIHNLEYKNGNQRNEVAKITTKAARLRSLEEVVSEFPTNDVAVLIAFNLFTVADNRFLGNFSAKSLIEANSHSIKKLHTAAYADRIHSTIPRSQSFIANI